MPFLGSPLTGVFHGPILHRTIIACGTIVRVHTRGWLGVAGQPTQIDAIADTNPDARDEFGDFFA